MISNPQNIYEEYQKKNLDKLSAVNLLISLIDNVENLDIRLESIKILEKIGSKDSKVFNILEKPKTPTQISKELQLNIGYVSNIIIELLDRKLIKCLSPNEKRHRFYQISKKGKEILEKISEVE